MLVYLLATYCYLLASIRYLLFMVFILVSILGSVMYSRYVCEI